MLKQALYKPAFYAACAVFFLTAASAPVLAAETAGTGIEKPTGEKPAGEKSAGEKSGDDKPGDDKPGAASAPENATIFPAEADLPEVEIDEDPRAEESQRIALIPRTKRLEEGSKVSPFTDVLNVRQTLRKYPFLREAMPGMRGADQIRLGRQKVGDTTLLYFFLNLRDEQGVCGAIGCPMTVWADEGYGYHKAMDILKKYYTGVQTRLQGGKLSMLFCDPVRGQSLWDFENGKFVHKGVDPKAPECMGEEDDTLEPAPLMMRGADEEDVDESGSAAAEEKAKAESVSEEAEKDNIAPANPAKKP